MIYWNSVGDFLAMGGYGFYVWGSFGVTALVMTIEPILVARQRKNTIARLKRQLRADARAENRSPAA
ncbi:MAG: heme exporter protein CcmD [Azonexus sp.]|jgi:heme exporter protein D|uniref:heme exporter protein CcmD n=1 Tax=Azonexus sp. TaxID=1872668 RepID=UPI00281D914C|nr:heme exporter protein CcmD [Azonexus sp.]MDR0776350.1 heme exporter protein CcmD [Azonexus sp.]